MRVVDVVRASAIFTTLLQLSIALEALLEEGVLVVVRCKDRLNNPTSFGYMDLLLNVRLPGGTHVGELQLHLEAIYAVMPIAPATTPRPCRIAPALHPPHRLLIPYSPLIAPTPTRAGEAQVAPHLLDPPSSRMAGRGA